MDQFVMRRVSKQHNVPIVLTGFVQRNDAPSFCRGEADFLLETVGWHRRVRVAAEKAETLQGLDEAVETGEAVVVSGSLRRADMPGCDLLEVHGLYPVDRFVPPERQRSAAVWRTEAPPEAASGEHARLS